MAIIIFNHQNPLDDLTADRIGRIYYYAHVNRGLLVNDNPQWTIKSFAQKAKEITEHGNLAIIPGSHEQAIGYCAWLTNIESGMTKIEALYSLPHSSNITVGTTLLDTVKAQAILLEQKGIELKASHYSLKNKFYQNRGFILTIPDEPLTSQKVIWKNPHYPHMNGNQ